MDIRNKKRSYSLEEWEKEMGFSEEFLKDSRYEYNKAKWLGKTHQVKMINKELFDRIMRLQATLDKMRCCGNCEWRFTSLDEFGETRLSCFNAESSHHMCTYDELPEEGCRGWGLRATELEPSKPRTFL